jgi:hypothetical protein
MLRTKALSRSWVGGWGGRARRPTATATRPPNPDLQEALQEVAEQG